MRLRRSFGRLSLLLLLLFLQHPPLFFLRLRCLPTLLLGRLRLGLCRGRTTLLLLLVLQLEGLLFALGLLGNFALLCYVHLLGLELALVLRHFGLLLPVNLLLLGLLLLGLLLLQLSLTLLCCLLLCCLLLCLLLLLVQSALLLLLRSLAELLLLLGCLIVLHGSSASLLLGGEHLLHLRLRRGGRIWRGVSRSGAS